MKVFKFLGYFLKYLLTSFFICLILFFIFYFLSNFYYNYRYNKNFVNIYTVVSPSMKPNINVYDCVVEFRVHESSLEVGDVITYLSDDNISVTHRIYKIIKDGDRYKYLVKGDNNLTIDSKTLEYKDILGKSYLVIPFIGHFQFFASTKLGWSIIVLIPCLIILIVELFKIIKVYKIKRKIKNINVRNNDDRDFIEIDKKLRGLQTKIKSIAKKE